MLGAFADSARRASTGTSAAAYTTVVDLVCHDDNLLFDIKYVVHNKFVRGIIYNNTMILTPSFYWVFESSEINTIPLFKAIDGVMKGLYKLPSIKDIDEEYIDKLYKDYSDNKIHIVIFYNTTVIVQPFDITPKWMSKDIITFDYNAILMNLYNLNINKVQGFKNYQIKLLNIDEVLKSYIYIHMMNKNSVIKDDIIEELKTLNIIYENETFIQHTDNKYKSYVSWRSSKINEKDVEEYFDKYSNTSMNENIHAIYKKFIEELNFKTYKNEKIISKIITS